MVFEDNKNRPSAPASTGTVPRKYKTPENGHGVHYDEIDAYPSAPPLELMDEIIGYECISFSAISIPPPESSEPSIVENDNREFLPPASKISEAEARSALLEHVCKHYCYGKSAVKNMAITRLEYTSAFHYELQSFTEKRETSWTFAPYTGGDIDSPEKGPAPLPWNITIYPEKIFSNEVKIIEVPHTSSVKQCHRCKGLKNVTCQECHGKGWKVCFACHGNILGREPIAYNKDPCFYCNLSAHGRGRQECANCNAKGKIPCPVCENTGLVRCFIQLTVIWKVNSSEHIAGNTDIPSTMLKVVTGQVAFEEEGQRVQPLHQFLDESINIASIQIIHKHLEDYHDQKMLGQRHMVRVIPITKVHYQWKRHIGQFYIYGCENKVYSPDYPQTCCWGCNIL